MIVCHRYKFIFIKTSKSAGTSLEIALSRYCGQGDIVTPISAKDEKIRTRLGYCRPQNCYAGVGDYGMADAARLLLKGKRKLNYYNHMSAAEVKDKVGVDIWNGYYKFCVVRNPWDRLLSLYFHRYKAEPRPSISQYIKSGVLADLRRLGPDLYRIDGQVAVDNVYRYEDLAEELVSLQELLGLPEPLQLPNAKGSFRKSKQHFSEMLSDAEISQIREVFADEVASLGYGS